jgi:SAM-dependent methyltransferase
MMLQSPQDLYVADLPQFWVDNNSDVRIFCQGWLHSFGAIQSAECRYDLLALCSWDGLVLELGCGKGFMAQSCKKQHTAVTWIGLDLNESFLQYATKNMDLAVVTNSDIDIPLRNACFDRIVCADFLEHLCDPLKLLTQLRQLIKPDGLLIASVPNIGHWMVVEDLLHGRWDLTPSGIMCVTHLRFGTRKTWEDMLCQAGWKILHIQADRLEMPPSWRDAMIDMVTRPDYDNLESITFKIVARLAD